MLLRKARWGVSRIEDCDVPLGGAYYNLVLFIRHVLFSLCFDAINSNSTFCVFFSCLCGGVKWCFFYASKGG